MNNDNFGYDQNQGENTDFFDGTRRPEEDISGVVENLSQPRTMIYSILSLVLGILSLVLCCCGGWFGLGLGVLAIVFSVVSRCHLGYFDGLSIAGLVLGIIGAVFGIAMIVLVSLLESGVFDAFFEEFYSDPALPNNPGNSI